MESTRLAPSPTGALHLGNARTFLVNWLMARQRGWRVVLRIEDIDGPRVKRGADAGAIEDLKWLGFDWDEGPVYQSHRLAAYVAALGRLGERGCTFYCACSRKDIEQAASAPHAGDGAVIYPGTCRNIAWDTDRIDEFAVRFRVPEATVSFEDRFAGRQSFDAARQLGDFVIRKNDGTPAYQLAVVVDDAEGGVTQVVRGDDLVESTPRQILLYRALGWEGRIPDYWHLPLVVGTDGRRLAKRHGDTRLVHYRERGVAAGRVLELLGRWCGIEDAGGVGTAGDLLERFDIATLPRERIVFGGGEDAWLCERSRR